MSTREALIQVVESLPEPQVREVLDFAQFIQHRVLRAQDPWDRMAISAFAGGFGPDEPEYTEEDVKPELNS